MKDYKIIALDSLGAEVCEVIVYNCIDAKTAIEEARQVFAELKIYLGQINVNIWFKEERK